MSEAGHAKNVINFETLSTFIINFGNTSQPSKDKLKMANLSVLLTNSQNALADVNDKLSAYTDAVNKRETAFNAMSKLAIRCRNAIAVCDVDQSTFADIKAIICKLQGKRSKSPAPTAPAAETKPPKTHSVNQMSYDDRVENFDLLVKQLEGQSAFTPNETDLQLTAVTGVLTDLRAKNTLVINTATDLSNARLTRNNLLCDETKGLVKVAGDVKKYIKSVFGANSPQFKQISGLKFTNQVK